MRYDDLHPNNAGRPEPEFVPKPGMPRPDLSEQNAESAGPVADREVPIPSGQATLLLHQWLDGEIPVSQVTASQNGSDAVDLWNRINNEAELLRSRTTPLYVHKRIMDALPDDLYRLRQPWYRRPLTFTPTAIIIAAAALVGIGAVIARFAAR